MISSKTAAVLTAIQESIASGEQRMAPATFSHCFGRAATSAGFRLARARGLIEVAYIGGMGAPVYRAAGTGAAIAQASTATRH